MNERSYVRIIIIGVVLVLAAAGSALMIGRGCRAEPPPPATITATPAPTMTGTATRPPATSTPVTPSATPVAPTPTAQILPSATPVAPTVTPTATTIAARGVHLVRGGETLWGIACAWYGDMPLRPGANPLTPCTCWRGIYAAGSRVRPPQLIYPGERLAIPAVCGQ